jgi:predicted transcriptional regulator
MSITAFRTKDGSLPPDSEQHRRRLAREAVMIAAALEEAAAGKTVSSEQIDAWVDSLGTDHELPSPRSGL